eukprot:CAMPEP_0202885808 /NCGR_PEP_ID=MMETSP1391-20130828/41854_1 /ASSEMBLY_ACC=CAM_ASM_000867 /TAXON_ID=1034604 /ORGANISM="Chlamydomonas leiostraca, Strain SAG 11-49" /LENGTH=372 /DNA_ID=CAMNT_0049569065 /DNA_START=50 /DNA_END=1168 /DNA_ORIENTATION=+
MQAQHTGCWNRCTTTSSRTLYVPPRRVVRSKALAPPQEQVCEVQAQFFATHAWADQLQQIQESALTQITQTFLGVGPAATKHAANGALRVPSLDEKSSFVLRTFKGGPELPHVYRTACTAPMGPGMVLLKIGAHANMDKGTPFLDLEIGGTADNCLVALMLTRRLCPILHPEYLQKYWRTVPPPTATASSAHQGELLSFAQLEADMRKRTQPYARSAFIGDATSKDSTAAAGSTPSSTSSTGAGGQQYVYRHFYSPQLWTRIATGGSGALFSFDARDPGALAAVWADVGRFVGLWCAWAAADAAPGVPPLTGDALHECRAYTRVQANALDRDEQTQGSVFLFGQPAVDVMKETVSGAATAAAAGSVPWWAQE